MIFKQRETWWRICLLYLTGLYRKYFYDSFNSTDTGFVWCSHSSLGQYLKKKDLCHHENLLDVSLEI